MLRREVLGRLQLNNDALETDKVRRVPLLQQLPFVPKLQWPKADSRYAAVCELKAEAFLIDRLEIASAHRPLDLKDRATDSEGFFSVDQLSILSAHSASFRVFRVPKATLAAFSEENNRRTSRSGSVREDGFDFLIGVGPVAVDQFADVIAFSLEICEGREIAIPFQIVGGRLYRSLQIFQLNQ